MTELQKLADKLFQETDGEKFSRLVNKLKKRKDTGEREQVLEILIRYVREGQLSHWREFLIPDINALVNESEINYISFFEWCVAQPDMAYWGTEGLLRTKGNAAFSDLIDLAQNSAFTVETRAKAVKELSRCSFQLFDRELPEDPGEWEGSDLRLEELKAWQIAGYPIGQGYPTPAAHSSLQNPQDDLERAAAKLNGKLERMRKKEKEDPANPCNRLVEADDGDIRRVAERWDLPPDYRRFLKQYSPLHVHIKNKRFPQGISLYGAGELIKKQDGYSYNPVLQCVIEDWPKEYIVIGDSGADPFCIDIQRPDSPVYYAEHGTGSWDFHIYADSFIDFLLNL